MNVSFRKATQRRTECYNVDVMGVRLLISYETVVAAQYKDVRIRIQNHWGPTTGRHINECIHKERYEEISDGDEFGKRVDALLMQAFVDKVAAKLN